jgi:hypothetical protein
MPIILTDCPRTGASIPTGVQSEWIELAFLPRVPIPVDCPACGQIHHWTTANAWAAGERAQAPVQRDPWFLRTGYATNTGA